MTIAPGATGIGRRAAVRRRQGSLGRRHQFPRSASTAATTRRSGSTISICLIDWGWFYFLTKPMFLAIDYFFHLVGNFGIAILIVTVLVKLPVLPARQQVLRLDGEDEGGAAADGDDHASATPTTR